ncbi:hypothetical protein [Streptomyces stelliscabiei]|uniref:hypothetical protein n=1 Tax=Streptomyces stelliscabiei TaxID=146820 RepID=UPI0029A1A8BC|nr:hypothetical protein [Streptomyces stelliscabiei]MDX2557725.1 hypothetical protein [Streptomyces stelliscabiei]MDX2617431.1 hypothetical protein [Streptomyces stelliscabiei]MDX2641582.1 hypothetical protein [Streptomyces stelliscabiei]MDX2667543.1 hypothetical protein [Streptomyces stelliscabiei]MDX2715849.1 hypothetical protein [Streptomyces stelliscabiei]
MPGITTPLRERKSRRPTGLPNPPMIVLCGPEKCGKSHEAARGTGSDLIGIAFWIEIGGSEGTADYYGRVPGANYEIVPHDGSYQDILDAIRWAVHQPQRVAGKPNMIVIDNGSNLWDMISDEQALFARRRAVNKAQESRRRAPSLDDPVVVDPDLWNRAKDRWGEILWMLRRHAGPVVMIARQEVVTAFENDKPTRNTTRKIKAEKNLPAAVDAIVEMRGIGDAYLTGVRTLHWDVKPGDTVRFEDFSIDALLRRMGFEEAATHRQVTESRPEAYLDEQQPTQPQRAQQRPADNELTGPKAAALIKKALEDPTNPEMALQGIREEWGIRTLQQIPTESRLGKMSADALIARSLAYIKAQAEKRQQGAGDQQRGETTGTDDGQGETTDTDDGQGETTSTPPAAVEQDQAREHRETPPESSAPVPPAPEQEPPAEGATPPPPDPQVEEPPSAETPEDTSAAEEPQDIPARPAARRAQRKKPNDPTEIARQALLDEAEVQARLKFTTRRDLLQPIYANGEPGLAQLRDFVQGQRAEVIALLEENDQPVLADVYRRAPMPDLGLAKKFAPYFDSAPAGQ